MTPFGKGSFSLTENISFFASVPEFSPIYKHLWCTWNQMLAFICWIAVHHLSLNSCHDLSSYLLILLPCSFLTLVFRYLLIIVISSDLTDTFFYLLCYKTYPRHLTWFVRLACILIGWMFWVSSQEKLSMALDNTQANISSCLWIMIIVSLFHFSLLYTILYPLLINSTLFIHLVPHTLLKNREKIILSRKSVVYK